MFELYDVVKLKKDNTELGVLASYIGAIVDVHNKGEAYAVEFIDGKGNTVEAALFEDFSEDELVLVGKADNYASN